MSVCVSVRDATKSPMKIVEKPRVEKWFIWDGNKKMELCEVRVTLFFQKIIFHLFFSLIIKRFFISHDMLPDLTWV